MKQQLIQILQHWQYAQEDRQAVIDALNAIPENEGHLIQEVIHEWNTQSTPTPDHTESHLEEAEQWRAELMAARAKTWDIPHRAVLLISPNIIILTDGCEGLMLREGEERVIRILHKSISSSLLLLGQTIIMANTALDTRELNKLREQRIDSTSTSLSEIEPIQ